NVDDYVFFFQAVDGIRDRNVTGVQTCALPISARMPSVSTPMRTSRMTSASLSECSVGSHSRPSAGMQYVQRRLQRSVKLTRRSRATRPKESTNWRGRGAEAL